MISTYSSGSISEQQEVASDMGQMSQNVNFRIIFFYGGQQVKPEGLEEIERSAGASGHLPAPVPAQPGTGVTSL